MSISESRLRGIIREETSRLMREQAEDLSYTLGQIKKIYDVLRGAGFNVSLQGGKRIVFNDTTGGQVQLTVDGATQAGGNVVIEPAGK